MKKATVLLIILLLAAVGGLAFLYLSANITVQYGSCVATDGVTQADYFDRMKKQIAENTFTGTLFDHSELGTADQYQYLTYTVDFTNGAFLDATTAEVSVTPMKGDILQIGDTEEHLLPSGRKTSLSVTILTPRGAQNVREATATWFIWGLPFSQKITLGN